MTSVAVSPILQSLIERYAVSELTSEQLRDEIVKQSAIEQIHPWLVRELIEKALLKKGLKERRIRELMPPEFKNQNKVRDNSSIHFKKIDSQTTVKKDDNKDTEDKIILTEKHDVKIVEPITYNASPAGITLLNDNTVITAQVIPNSEQTIVIEPQHYKIIKQIMLEHGEVIPIKLFTKDGKITRITE